MNKGLEIKTIEKGAFSGHKERGNYVIKNQEEWQNLWDKTHPYGEHTPQLPSIDFDSEMVVGVFQGERSSSGYSISIEELVAAQDTLDVHVSETHPVPGMIYASAMVQSYHLIKTPKKEEVNFTKK